MSDGPTAGAPADPAAFPTREVHRIARLARIDVSVGEARRFAADFAGLLAHIAAIRHADVAGAEPFVAPGAAADVLRDDAPRPGLPRDVALDGAPDVSDGAFRVPRVAPDPGA